MPGTGPKRSAMDPGCAPRKLLPVLPSRAPEPGSLIGEGPLARVGLSQVLFSDGGVGVGITRVQLNDPVWRVASTIGPYHHVVYSYAPMKVSFEGAGSYVITPNEVVCQPPGQVYQRQEMYAGQELSVFAAVTPEVAALVGLERACSPGPLHVAGLPLRMSLQAWQLAHELMGRQAADRQDLEFAERAATLVAATVAVPSASCRPAKPVSPLTLRSHQALVSAVREHLATSYAQRTLPLGRLAGDIGVSPHHMARVFRAVTGHSIHQYRVQLRLRAALAGLATRQPITDLAISCGFATPSHLSDLFHRHFQIPPSQLRRELRAGGSRSGPGHAASQCGGQEPSSQARCP